MFMSKRVLTIRKANNLTTKRASKKGTSQAVVLIARGFIGRLFRAESIRIVARRGETHELRGMEKPVKLTVTGMNDVSSRDGRVNLDVDLGDGEKRNTLKRDKPVDVIPDGHEVCNITFDRPTDDDQESRRDVPVVGISLELNREEQARVSFPVEVEVTYEISYGTTKVFILPADITTSGSTTSLVFGYAPSEDQAMHYTGVIQGDDRVLVEKQDVRISIHCGGIGRPATKPEKSGPLVEDIRLNL